MSDLQYRQQKIQEKRKQTPFRQFVKEICSWRNIVFYKNEVGVSKYPQHPNRLKQLITLDQHKKEHTGDLTHGFVYDGSKTFFEQRQELYYSYPYPVVNHYGYQENAERWDEVRGAKNVYLSVAVGDDAENVLYTFKGETKVANILSSSNVTQRCENIYWSKFIIGSFNIFYSKFIYSSSDIWFSTDLMWCQECILCHDLENASYCIENKQLTKEEYLIKKQEIVTQKHTFEHRYTQLPVEGRIRLSEQATWHTLYKCKQVENAYELSNFQRARNILYCDGGSDSSDCYDVIDCATDRTHHLYAVMWQAFGDHVYCSANVAESSFIYYSLMLQDCSYCLGCTWLVGKSFCIFNKQYTKEERHKKVDEIFSAMEQEGTLGDFFPWWMNPFYFNDTSAYLIDDSFTKKEVEAEGYLWREEEVKVDIPEGLEVVKTSELGEYEGRKQTPLASGHPPLSGGPNEKAPLIRGGGSSEVRDGGVWKTRWIDPVILNKVIQDEQWNVYRIVKMEYDFLMKHGLPLPRLHWLERLRQNFKIH